MRKPKIFVLNLYSIAYKKSTSMFVLLGTVIIALFFYKFYELIVGLYNWSVDLYKWIINRWNGVNDIIKSLSSLLNNFSNPYSFVRNRLPVVSLPSFPHIGIEGGMKTVKSWLPSRTPSLSDFYYGRKQTPVSQANNDTECNSENIGINGGIKVSKSWLPPWPSFMNIFSERKPPVTKSNEDTECKSEQSAKIELEEELPQKDNLEYEDTSVVDKSTEKLSDDNVDDNDSDNKSTSSVSGDNKSDVEEVYIIKGTTDLQNYTIGVENYDDEMSLSLRSCPSDNKSTSSVSGDNKSDVEEVYIKGTTDLQNYTIRVENYDDEMSLSLRSCPKPTSLSLPEAKTNITPKRTEEELPQKDNLDYEDAYAADKSTEKLSDDNVYDNDSGNKSTSSVSGDNKSDVEETFVNNTPSEKELSFNNEMKLVNTGIADEMKLVNTGAADALTKIEDKYRKRDNFGPRKRDNFGQDRNTDNFGLRKRRN